MVEEVRTMTARTITYAAAIAGVVFLAAAAPVGAQSARENAERNYDPVKSMLLAFPQDNVREAQRALTGHGYDPGAVDGWLDSRTEYALRSFQRDHGMPPDGKLTPQTMAALRENAGAASPRSTEDDAPPPDRRTR
jgi:peptidoglycan hydrolase-like protein with peptidoglycan-binding domain